MDPELACPRCATPMTPRIAAPRPGAKRIRADVCGTCAGIWLDEYELGEVDDALGRLPFRVEELASASPRVQRLQHCPRCGAAPVEIALLDVSLDVCPACKGVWMDGGEYEALARATTMEAARRAETSGTYRTAPAAAKAVREGMFACPRCEEEQPVGQGMITPSGLVCSRCFHEHDEAALLADASRDHGDLTARMKQGALRPHEASVGREGWSRVGATAGGAIQVLGLFVGLGPALRCDHCGRERRDPFCSHH